MASPQTLEAGVIALTQLMGDVKKRVESLDNMIIPEVNQIHVISPASTLSLMIFFKSPLRMGLNTGEDSTEGAARNHRGLQAKSRRHLGSSKKRAETAGEDPRA